MPRMGPDSAPLSLVLASASPRRQRLIAWLGLPVEALPVDVDEPLDAPLPPDAIAVDLAESKALAASAIEPEAVCLGFDTIVVLDGRPLGKPGSDDEARQMLDSLSGRHHFVVTGAAIAVGGRVIQSFAVQTDVEMRTLHADEVDRWLARGEHLGCAGAYNIEHHLARVTEDECFQNVAGLPLCHLYRELARLDSAPLHGLTAPVEQCDRALGRRCRLGPRVCGLTP